MNRLLIGTLLLCLSATPALAKKMVYSPTVDEGEKEIEYYLDWRENGAGRDVVGHELAFEYGFMPMNRIAIYAVYEQQSGDDLTLLKYKVEWVRQLFEQGERSWDTGLYFEYQVQAQAGHADAVEFKALFEKQFHPILVTFNGVFEKEIGEHAAGGTTLGYALRVALRKSAKLVPAIEAFGSLGEIQDFSPTDQQSHLIGPVVDVMLTRGLMLHGGVLFGLTDGSEDVRVKTQLAYEWY